MKKKSKNAIALLITIFFIIAITIAVGIGLKNINTASKYVENEKFMLQTTMILDDVLTLLQTSKELDDITKDATGEAFNIFLSQASFIPIESGDIQVSIELKSARAKFNPNSLINTNKNVNEARVNALKQYLSKYMVNNEYVSILLDNMGGIKENIPYNSEIFYDKPYLYRDYINSTKHLSEINQFYLDLFGENNLKESTDNKFEADLNQLFYFSNDKNMTIDLNYATAQTFELILGTDRQRAILLSENENVYYKIEELNLSPEEKVILLGFKTSFFEPYLEVIVEIKQKDKSAIINFEYDIKEKKGYNFAYEI